jgi:hypothetical protein
MAETIYQGWQSVLQAGTDYEADLVRDRLDEAGIPAVVLTQRDHAFNLTLGELAQVHVMVPPDRVEEARQILAAPAVSEAELEAAALEADPHAPPAHDPSTQALLDSGIEAIRLSVPDTDPPPAPPEN